MNPARTFGPNLVATDFTSYWVYVAGPLVGAVLAVGAAWVLRGAGGGRAGSACGTGKPFHRSRAPGQGVNANWRRQRRIDPPADLALLFLVK